MPHIKSFGRYQVDDQGVRLPWLVLTSHNLSKAAWGALQKNGEHLRHLRRDFLVQCLVWLAGRPLMLAAGLKLIWI